MAKADSTPAQKLKDMLAFGTKLFAVPKAEYDEREAKRQKRRRPNKQQPG
ncbi:MAG TPA: hypothetical protein VFE35_10220 [Candidatus Cybelea sp.]|jgi:hypothetical protein|nr:hypothetical protein [Candidatus Cybelea sp.]